MSQDDRRTAPRHDLNVDVTFESEHNFYTGLTQDLGGGGLFVSTRVLRPIGECVRVRLTLPGSPEVLDAIAEIRWVRPVDTAEGDAGMGLQFLQMSGKTKQAVKEFVAKREAMILTDGDVTHLR